MRRLLEQDEAPPEPRSAPRLLLVAGIVIAIVVATVAALRFLGG